MFKLRIVMSKWREVGNPAEGIELGDAHFMHVKSRLKSCRFSCESAARLFSYFGDLAPLSSLRYADGGGFFFKHHAANLGGQVCATIGHICFEGVPVSSMHARCTWINAHVHGNVPDVIAT